MSHFFNCRCGKLHTRGWVGVTSRCTCGRFLWFIICPQALQGIFERLCGR